MAIPLAIGYLAGARRKSPAERADPASSACPPVDSIDARPQIPRGVVTWDDIALPVGAGDPASELGGPAPFQPIERARQRQHAAIDDAWFGVVVVALMAAVHYPLFEAAGNAVASRAPTTPVAAQRRAVVATALEPNARHAFKAWSSLDVDSSGS